MIRKRRRTGRWVTLGALAVVVFAAFTAWLTAPRPGGRMDPLATSPGGAHALVALLRDRGVEVVIADTVAEVERAGQQDALLLFAETANTRGDEAWSRLAAVPGDRLVLEPTPRAREALAPAIRLSRDDQPDSEPGCDLREADRAGSARLETSAVYQATGDTPMTRCYGGALVRYADDGRAITVVGNADFMTNGSLLKEGDAALAMNLTGDRARLIWYSPQRVQGDRTSGATIGDLIPARVGWIVAQLCLVVALLAIWQARRLGPLVAERLPVVVRASETTEGRARLYRSRRARGRAAAALRTATLHRLIPRLGLGANAADAAVVSAVSRRCHIDDAAVGNILFGPAPATDTDLVHLAQALDDIERQVIQS
ncbi:DUF4350 domain-containing protein [Mycolicibacterium sp.]|uniref:DUF4350 domain-containing protein n=1 Tax=Mycolicibacterium sp. TaxID=2320850 RepID=UPI001DCF801B|nr:DUF4350 domain-containing protein [Mycolicibacterium sp.]MCB1291195.1 DUF4350 domain-containing protein [Mycobacterium sp.]MCB9408906.1 DUF4350 domain-containing protein [Mycolicibacterium sp.]